MEVGPAGVSEELLQILCCPVTKVAVRRLEPAGLEALNAAVAAGGARHADGTPVGQPLEAALVTADRATVYRVEAGIPVMLPGLGIPTAALADWPA